ncbi:MAG: esterase-like activity of phytase family protein [Prevotellaceae bacterium]|nr:esterase-like activity of phytase family protein [Candidatus Minthosoma caballi]
MDILKQISLALFAIAPGNYSGITPIGGDEYAVVDDKELVDGFRVLNIKLDPENGNIIDASMREPDGFVARRASIADKQSVYRDCEGVAFCAERGTVFISGEEDQRILEYDLSGVPTGNELEVPEYFHIDNIAGNYGFEALTYNDATKLFWTTTESTLLSDGFRSDLQHTTISNRLRLQSFGTDLKPKAMYAYEMDKPTVKKKKGTLVHGVPTMLALDDGKLIVMEREAYVAKSYFGSFCRVKLYEVDLAFTPEVSATQRLADLPSSAFARKKLLAQFKTTLNLRHINFANYEGMCLGPKLADGRQTIILIADSQGRHGNKLYRLKDYVRVLVM